jgi:hypothetical protein
MGKWNGRLTAKFTGDGCGKISNGDDMFGWFKKIGKRTVQPASELSAQLGDGIEVDYRHYVSLVNDCDRYHDALEKIERWHGEFPVTGRFWDDDKTQPMNYSACWGSNGERDYMRAVARKALGRA